MVDPSMSFFLQVDALFQLILFNFLFLWSGIRIGYVTVVHARVTFLLSGLANPIHKPALFSRIIYELINFISISCMLRFKDFFALGEPSYLLILNKVGSSVNKLIFEQ